MRLINARLLTLEEFRASAPPRYAIVSHRWEDEEVTFEDFRCGRIEKRNGFYKLEGACRKALQYNCEWVWLDTCCIDKSSSSELTEAINSMFRWYKAAHVCFVYLYDFCDTGNKRFENCEWFTRGWTLQELIAPRGVVFFDRDWQDVGRKSELSKCLAKITGIDIDVLRGADPATCSIAQRLSWAAKRKTTQVEDQAYCLLGLFNVSMPMLYGESERAFVRLQEEIIKYSNDFTVFAWDRNEGNARRSGLLAGSPASFAMCQDIVQAPRFPGPMQGFSMTNIGISINLLTIPYTMNTYLAILECCRKQDPQRYIGILLERLSVVDQFVRVEVAGRSVVTVRYEMLRGIAEMKRRPLLVRQVQLESPLAQNHAFWVRSLQLPSYRTKQLARSKLFSRDGHMSRHDGMGVLKIPEGQYGTAGMIQLRTDEGGSDWWQVEYLVFGFDEDFVPYCMIGNSGLGKRSYAFVREVARTRDCRDEAFEQTFSNNWLREELRTTSRTRFKRDNCCIIRCPSTPYGEVALDYLNLVVVFQLVSVPEELLCLRPHPWSVWAIDVQRGEGPSPQALAERDLVTSGATTMKRMATTSLPKWGARTLLTSIGVDALADL